MILKSIKYYSRPMSVDERWDEHAELVVRKWKKVIDRVPRDSETGRGEGRLRYYCQVKISRIVHHKVNIMEELLPNYTVAARP